LPSAAVQQRDSHGAGILPVAHQHLIHQDPTPPPPPPYLVQLHTPAHSK
jgi:hypothetical protein